MAAPHERTRHRFTGAEVERMLDADILTDRHFELLQGDLVSTPPQGPIHCGLVERLHAALRSVYAGYRIRAQMPIVASPNSEPEPDLAVVRGPVELRHPRCSNAVLVIEVAVTSLWLDEDKAAIYAQGGVPEYWIVDVPSRQLLVYTGPSPHSYRTQVTFNDKNTVPLPHLQTTWWSVASLLP